MKITRTNAIALAIVIHDSRFSVIVNLPQPMPHRYLHHIEKITMIRLNGYYMRSAYKIRKRYNLLESFGISFKGSYDVNKSSLLLFQHALLVKIFKLKLVTA